MRRIDRRPAEPESRHEPALLEALDRERARVASILRSETAQVLATVLLGLTSALGSDDLAEIREIMGDLRTAVRDDLKHVQALAADLRPSVLDDFGLISALRSLAEGLEGRDAPLIEIALMDAPDSLPPAQRGLVFQTLAEALRNAAQHARARSIRVSVARSADDLQFEVTDDGCGFDVAGISAEPARGFGLNLMRAQARALGGSLDIDSEPGRGTRLVLRVPALTSQGGTKR